MRTTQERAYEDLDSFLLFSLLFLLFIFLFILMPSVSVSVCYGLNGWKGVEGDRVLKFRSVNTVFRSLFLSNVRILVAIGRKIMWRFPAVMPLIYNPAWWFRAISLKCARFVVEDLCKCIQISVYLFTMIVAGCFLSCVWRQKKNFLAEPFFVRQLQFSTMAGAAWS